MLNRAAPTKIRELRITGERGMFMVDYIHQDLYLFQNAEAPSRWDTLDDLIDPASDGINVFGAIMADRTLGITAFEATAVPLLTAVSAPTRVSEADGSVTFYELILPVQVLVQRS
jgi:hypothetical protein